VLVEYCIYKVKRVSATSAWEVVPETTEPLDLEENMKVDATDADAVDEFIVKLPHLYPKPELKARPFATHSLTLS
jgi:hypothetical protein